MIQIILLVAVALLCAMWTITATRVDWSKRKDRNYYELTLFLGSGGHTGELCEMLHGFKMHKVARVNVLIASTDRSSQSFFRSYIKRDHAVLEDEIMRKTHFYYIMRTNEVKQSYLTAIFTTIHSLVSSLYLIAKQLLNSTHFVSNGPGTSVPLFFIFFVLKMVKLAKAKLIFIESWCRVQQLSLTGKLVKPIVDQFIVHWPQLAAKYKKCKYFEKML